MRSRSVGNSSDGMEGGHKEQLGALTLCSALGGVLGIAAVIFGALVQWAGVMPDLEEYGRYVLLGGVVLYLVHLLEALCKSKTSKYLYWILSETEFASYVKELQSAKPEIRWTIQNYHYEERRTRDKDGKEKVERKRVNTHRAQAYYDIQGFLDETLSPEQTLAMFHLLYDGEHEDLEANKKKSRRIFLLCEMPLEYHAIDDQEEQRLFGRRETFFRENTRDTHQDKKSEHLISCHHKSHVMVILKEGTDDSRARPWWMSYWFYAICTVFLMSVPFRVFFFSQCAKIQWEVLKHFSHKQEELWTEDPKHSRAKRTDAASKAFRKVKREMPARTFSGKRAAWDEGPASMEDVGPPVTVPVGVPSYWKNRDLDKDFDEKINLSPDEREKMQQLLDVTFKNKATRDRKSDGMPTRLIATQVIRMEDSKMWRRFEQKRAELALKGQLALGPTSCECVSRVQQMHMHLMQSIRYVRMYMRCI